MTARQETLPFSERIAGQALAGVTGSARTYCVSTLREGKWFVSSWGHDEANALREAKWELKSGHLHIQGKVEMNQGWMFEHSDWMKPHIEGMKKALEL